MTGQFLPLAPALSISTVVQPSALLGQCNAPNPSISISPTVIVAPQMGTFGSVIPYTVGSAVIIPGSASGRFVAPNNPSLSLSTYFAVDVIAGTPTPLATQISVSIARTPAPGASTFIPIAPTPVAQSGSISTNIMVEPIAGAFTAPNNSYVSVSVLCVEATAIAGQFSQPGVTIIAGMPANVTPAPIGGAFSVPLLAEYLDASLVAYDIDGQFSLPTSLVVGTALFTPSVIGGQFLSIDPTIVIPVIIAPVALGGQFSLQAPALQLGTSAEITLNAVSGQFDAVHPSVATTVSVAVAPNSVTGQFNQPTAQANTDATASPQAIGGAFAQIAVAILTDVDEVPDAIFGYFTPAQPMLIISQQNINATLELNAIAGQFMPSASAVCDSHVTSNSVAGAFSIIGPSLSLSSVIAPDAVAGSFSAVTQSLLVQGAVTMNVGAVEGLFTAPHVFVSIGSILNATAAVAVDNGHFSLMKPTVKISRARCLIRASSVIDRSVPRRPSVIDRIILIENKIIP